MIEVETVSHIDASAVPSPGLAGHMSGAQLRNKVTQVANLDKLKTVAASGCPVNRKTPTKMSKAAFIRACNKYRGVAENDRNHKNKFSTITLTGFKTNNRRMCVNCRAGEKIAKEEKFTPPDGITFVDLEDITVRTPVKLKVKSKKKLVTKAKPKARGIKLTQKDVIRIRKMHAEGYTVPGLCAIFPVTPSTMYRVVNKESWRDVE